jgi:hypothetical protein
MTDSITDPPSKIKPQNVTLKTFIETVFMTDDFPEDDFICLSTMIHQGNAEFFVQREVTPRTLRNFKPGSAALYFCISSLSRATGIEPPLDRAGLNKYRRRKDDCRELYVVVLDDIGTKVEAAAVGPSYIIESSAGNYQYGYLIEPFDVSTPGGEAFFDSCFRAMAEAGMTDPGIPGVNRVMRVPGSRHLTKDFTSVVVLWEPDLVWDLPALMKAFGLDVGTVKKLRKRGSKARDRVAFEDIDDPVLDWLSDNGYTTGAKDADFIQVLCPWKENHSVGSGDTAKYSPLGYGTRSTYQGGRAFKCHHAHCSQEIMGGQAQGLKEYLAWVRENAGPDLSIKKGVFAPAMFKTKIGAPQ